MTRQELLDALRKADGPGRELDADIAKALGFNTWSICIGDARLGSPWRECGHSDDIARLKAQYAALDAPDPDYWFMAREPEVNATKIPHYTASLDAALKLVEEVLPGWFIKLSGVHTDGHWRWSLWAPDTTDTPTTFHGHSNREIALLIALLTALDAKGAG